MHARRVAVLAALVALAAGGTVVTLAAAGDAGSAAADGVATGSPEERPAALLELTTAAGPAPSASPVRARSATGGVWLSTLTPVAATNGWGRPEVDLSNGGGDDGDGDPIRLAGEEFPSGLGVHAPSRLEYALDPADRTFTALVGVDDETEGRGTVRFRVLVDGRLAWSSDGVRRGGDAPEAVTVDVRGHRRLVLEVTDGGDGTTDDHADWADARLSR